MIDILRVGIGRVPASARWAGDRHRIALIYILLGALAATACSAGPSVASDVTPPSVSQWRESVEVVLKMMSDARKRGSDDVPNRDDQQFAAWSMELAMAQAKEGAKFVENAMREHLARMTDLLERTEGLYRMSLRTSLDVATARVHAAKAKMMMDVAAIRPEQVR